MESSREKYCYSRRALANVMACTKLKNRTQSLGGYEAGRNLFKRKMVRKADPEEKLKLLQMVRTEATRPLLQLCLYFCLLSCTHNPATAFALQKADGTSARGN